MRKVALILALAFFALVMSGSALAEEIKAEKYIESASLQTGDYAKIKLLLSNPYNEDVKVRIRDKNILGNAGIDIQCLEYVLSAGKKTEISLEPVIAYEPGTFNLPGAEIEYTDPVSGERKIVYSNALSVTVKDSGKASGYMRGITSIYECGGISMRSSSYSSSSSFSFSFGSQGSGNMNSGVQNNQMNQNMNEVRREMKEMEKRMRSKEKRFRENIAKSGKFLKEHKNLLSKGYNLTEMETFPKSSDSGSFRAKYRSSDGREAEISGVMENGTISEISSISDEKKKAMLNELYENPEFLRAENMIRRMGYNKTDALFEQEKNKTRITVKYRKGEKEAKIEAIYENGAIKDVKAKIPQSEEEKKRYQNMFWILALIILLSLLAYALHKRYGGRKRENKAVPKAVEKSKRPYDFRKEALGMLRKAEEMYSSGRKKDAYEMVSRAVRLYLARKSGLEGDATAKELIRHLRKSGKEWKKPKECLDICSMVEFAKANPEKRSFRRATDIARSIINENRGKYVKGQI